MFQILTFDSPQIMGQDTGQGALIKKKLTIKPSKQQVLATIWRKMSCLGVVCALQVLH